MFCTDCEDEALGAASSPPREARGGSVLCDRCGAVILILAGVAVGVGDATLAYLARFGLASTGQPLLERREKGV
jgi:hypothetical protein